MDKETLEEQIRELRNEILHGDAELVELNAMKLAKTEQVLLSMS